MEKGIEKKRQETEELMRLFQGLGEEEKREIKGIMIGIKMVRDSERKTA